MNISGSITSNCRLAEMWHIPEQGDFLTQPQSYLFIETAKIKALIFVFVLGGELLRNRRIREKW